MKGIFLCTWFLYLVPDNNTKRSSIYPQHKLKVVLSVLFGVLGAFSFNNVLYKAYTDNINSYRSSRQCHIKLKICEKMTDTHVEYIVNKILKP